MVSKISLKLRHTTCFNMFPYWANCRRIYEADAWGNLKDRKNAQKILTSGTKRKQCVNAISEEVTWRIYLLGIFTPPHTSVVECCLSNLRKLTCSFTKWHAFAGLNHSCICCRTYECQAKAVFKYFFLYVADFTCGSSTTLEINLPKYSYPCVIKLIFRSQGITLSIKRI